MDSPLKIPNSSTAPLFGGNIFSPHELFIQERIAADIARYFDKEIKKSHIDMNDADTLFPKLEKRSLDELIPSNDLYEVRRQSNKKEKNNNDNKNDNDDDNDDDETQIEKDTGDDNYQLKTELFSQSYFVLRTLEDEDKKMSRKKKKNHGDDDIDSESDDDDDDDDDDDSAEAILKRRYIVELDKEKYKMSNEILKDSNKFLEKESVLKGIHKSVLAPNINKKNEQKYMNAIQKAQKLRTAGKGWYNMPEVIMTPEVRQELIAMKLKHVTSGGDRAPNVGDDDLNIFGEEEEEEENENGASSLNEKKKKPKFFQIGTIVEGPTDFYSNRLLKRDRKTSILEEIIHEQEETNYINERYKQLQADKLTTGQKRKKRKLMTKSTQRKK